MSNILNEFPYFSQRDNAFNPSGSCNVTSVAMCLSYLGVKATKEEQLEDELYAELTALGWSRHDPLDLSAIANTYKGVDATFTTTGTMQDIYSAIDSGYPCILHGYFTRFGHIIVVKGYDSKGLIVNDPWGEWHDYGYDTSVSGEGLHYSNGLIARTCSPESLYNPADIFLHVIKAKH